jgi:lipopolysaccharide transport system ATP-binding protein
MSDVVIRGENLGKRYQIGERERYLALRDVLARALKSPARIFRPPASANRNRSQGHIWALKDVSFEIRQGEVVGIIGRNGAGKTTLLKILARVTKPTRGFADIRGRVGSLLEVGAGFHPELTGRENVFLSGAILGMGKSELQRKFDEIVAFAEVEKFIDTPLKHYSTGMQTRLAFAVAAHLDPDILLVDEVLAVGDVRFQKKCLGRMGDVAQTGRTIMFVSHDMRKMTTLCTRGLLLSAGGVDMEGEITAVAAAYLREGITREAFVDLSARGDRSGSGEARFSSIALSNGSKPTSTFEFGSDLVQKITVIVHSPAAAALIQIVIVSADGVAVHELLNVHEGCVWKADSGIYEFVVTVPQLRLYPGTYTIDLWLGSRHSARVDYITNAAEFHVVQTANSGLERPLDRADGLVFQSAQWSCRQIPAVDEAGVLLPQ